VSQRRRRPATEERSEEPQGPAPAAPPPAPEARLLALQRSHGNAVVTRMLARQPVDAGVPPPAGVERSPSDVAPPRTGDKADMDRALREYMAGEHWPQVVQVLNGFTQEDIDERIKGYLPEWRTAIIRAAPGLGKDAERVRAPAEIDNARAARSGDAMALAQALHRYPDRVRLPVRIGELNAREIAHALRWAHRGSLQETAVALAHAAVAFTPEMDALSGAALGRRDLWEATVLLNALAGPELEAQLGRLKPADLFELKVAADNQGLTRLVGVLGVEPRASVIRKEEIDRSFSGEVSIERWDRADAALQRYADDAERNAALGRLTVPQLIGLALHLRGGKGVAAATPTGVLVERALRPRLDAAYAAALPGGSGMQLVWLLRGYPDADVLAKARDVQRVHGQPGVAACATAARMMLPEAHMITRAFAFLPLEVQTGVASRPATTQTMTMNAPAGAAVAVPGGSVTAYDAIQQPGGRSKWFGFSYQGADAEKTGWLQFLAREAEMFDSKGKSAGFETSVETMATGQPEKRKWGTTAKPYWTIDSAGGNAPFYEAPDASGSAFANTASPTKTEIYDRPELNRAVTNAAFDNELDEDDFEDGKVAAVVVRLRFHDYLVRGMDVLYANTMTVEFRLTARNGTPTRTNTAGRGAAASKLLPEHHEALVRRYPAWSFYAR
jgi:hypothetical protein